MLALNIASMRAHTRPCLLRRLCLFWTFTCIFEHELAYFKFSIVYLLFSLINVQPSALYLEFAFKGILKICLLPRSANQLPKYRQLNTDIVPIKVLCFEPGAKRKDPGRKYCGLYGKSSVIKWTYVITS